jgi:hypothetical protein
VGSDWWVGRSLVDSWRSQWRSAKRQYSFGGMSECRWSASADQQKALFCVSLECVECVFPWCTARPCSSLVSHHYWWPQMSHYIGEYCKTCDLCLQTKAQKRPPMGELKPLPIPEGCWDVASVDFIAAADLEPELIDGEEHYKVEEILDSQLFRNKLQYLGKCRGCQCRRTNPGVLPCQSRSSSTHPPGPLHQHLIPLCAQGRALLKGG